MPKEMLSGKIVIAQTIIFRVNMCETASLSNGGNPPWNHNILRNLVKLGTFQVKEGVNIRKRKHVQKNRSETMCAGPLVSHKDSSSKMIDTCLSIKSHRTFNFSLMETSILSVVSNILCHRATQGFLGRVLFSRACCFDVPSSSEV